MTRLRVEVSRRFVSEENLGPIDKRARQRHALLFTAGKLRGIMREPFAQTDAFEQSHRLVAHLLLAAQFERYHHVLHCRERGEQLKVLEDEADGFVANTRAPVLIERAEVNACEMNRARGRLIESGAEAEQRCLAAAGRPDDGARRAGFNREADFLHDGQAAAAVGITLRELPHFQDRTRIHALKSCARTRRGQTFST